MGRGSYSSKDTVEESLIFSAKGLKDIINRPNIPIGFSWKSGSSISVIYKPDYNALEFSCVMTNTKEDIKYSVPVIKQDCNYGNIRYYFECPNKNCCAKVYKLYKAPSSKYFLCGKCQNLTYDEQKSHNKRFDAFSFMKYDRKIEELMMTGKVKDRNKAYKLMNRRDKSRNWNIDKINSFLDSMPKSTNTTITYKNGVKVKETREIL